MWCMGCPTLFQCCTSWHGLDEVHGAVLSNLVLHIHGEEHTLFVDNSHDLTQHVTNQSHWPHPCPQEKEGVSTRAVCCTVQCRDNHSLLFGHVSADNIVTKRCNYKTMTSYFCQSYKGNNY